MSAGSSKQQTYGWYFLFVYLILLWITRDTVSFSAASTQGTAATFFLANAFLSYNTQYLLPAILLTWLANKLFSRFSGGGRWTAGVAIFLGAITTLFFYANAKLHALYGMFVNGFVVNLIVTPGGIESLGGSNATTLTFALIALGFVAVHALLLFVAKKLSDRGNLSGKGKWLVPVVALFLVSSCADRATYAYSSALGDSRILAYSEGIPYYVGVTARSLFKTLGFKVNAKQANLSVKDEGASSLNYPLHPLDFKQPAKPLNIVWLVSESLRADMLDQEIMPATWDFAQHGQRFTHHFSGGNGTRNGIFTMFTGIPGNYWESFFELNRGAPIIDVLQKQNYQMSLYTSAKFSYPEFDKTIFSKVPASELHTLESGAGWQRDRENVGNLLKFIDQRDPKRPFFTFMFFESPHARYYFPPESVIRTPYRDDINYATLSKEQLRNDIVPIKNRYINAVHHLDSQFARVFDYLKQNNLLDNTIVIVTGDHGEEFMEAGYWGHNSTISDPQVRTPMVLWVPGMVPGVHDKMTSHLDIIPTIMPMLGVTNPVEDYSVGISLLSPQKRDHVIITAWTDVGYIDDTAKITLPIGVQTSGRHVTDVHDKPLEGAEADKVFEQKQGKLLAMMKELGRYKKKANP
ncbi:sulfatase [Novimethylophilus kurashikiensis]|uniref:Sulfatase n=1 Tax=Novimethylophilus kurashikiensis TaxID=1825523 RepID=A0A2R5F5I2_9PROT|nr:sulfatase-like hydrolase/transferase [Novimethylophilus kurashikiensis]GBG13415.1 sulfatase [Novimethylophilus kurashikiensis]